MKRYSYEEAVDYLAENGVGISPACVEGEYVSELLDEAFEDCDYITQDNLDDIIEKVSSVVDED